MKAPLVTEQRAALLENGGGSPVNHTTRCRSCGYSLPTPTRSGCWHRSILPTAIQQGVMDVGIGMPELGHIKLSDLASIVGPNKQPVARDLYFQAVRPLSEYLRLAQKPLCRRLSHSHQAGRIISVLLQTRKV